MNQIAEKISNAGGKLYEVGGCVRDKILGIPPKDFDYCVTGLDVQEFMNLFPQANVRGKDFPVFDLIGSEFALARTERKISNGHKGFSISTDKTISIEDDLRRRDITINSMAFDVLEKKLIDPYGGKKDCENKLVRATSEAFCEDPLRVYRAARFAAKFNFTVEPHTLELMKSLREELPTLSVERVFEELRKAISESKPSTFFYVLKDANCLDIHFKEIADLINVKQPIEYHPEGDAFIHTMEVLDRCALLSQNEIFRFSALVHDLGKAKTPKENWPHHYEHEELGVECIKNLCNRLKLPTSWKKAGITSSREHMRAGNFSKMKASTKVDFLERISKTILGLEGLEIIANSDTKREENIQFADLGKKMLENINAKTLNIENEDFKVIKEKVRAKRIAWLTFFTKMLQ